MYETSDSDSDIIGKKIFFYSKKHALINGLLFHVQTKRGYDVTYIDYYDENKGEDPIKYGYIWPDAKFIGLTTESMDIRLNGRLSSECENCENIIECEHTFMRKSRALRRTQIERHCEVCNKKYMVLACASCGSPSCYCGCPCGCCC